MRGETEEPVQVPFEKRGRPKSADKRHRAKRTLAKNISLKLRQPCFLLKDLVKVKKTAFKIYLWNCGILKFLWCFSLWKCELTELKSVICQLRKRYNERNVFLKIDNLSFQGNKLGFMITKIKQKIVYSTEILFDGQNWTIKRKKKLGLIRHIYSVFFLLFFFFHKIWAFILDFFLLETFSHVTFGVWTIHVLLK